MKRIAITGGAGFLGINLLRYLLKTQQHDILIIDVDDKMNRHLYLPDISENQIYFLYLDLSNPHIDLDLNVDYVIHLAAWPHVDYSFYHPAKSMLNNITSLTHIADFCFKKNIPLLFTSSVEIYGGSNEHYIFEESHKAKPLSPYGFSKQCCEEIVNSYIQMGLNANIVRLTNLYGPFQLPDRVIPRLITRSLCDVITDIDTAYCRDFLYIDDAVNALVNVMQSKQYNQIYNLSSGMSHSMHEIANEIANITNKQCYVNITSKNATSVRGKNLIISNDKIKSKFNWRPKTDLQTGLRQTFKWYQQHKNWWEMFSEILLHDRSGPGYIVDCVFRSYSQRL